MCEGWGVDPRRNGDQDAPLTADTLVVELTYDWYVDTERMMRFLTYGCNPGEAAKDNHIFSGCKENKCSLLCGCRGHCSLGPSPSAVAATDDDSEERVG